MADYTARQAPEPDLPGIAAGAGTARQAPEPDLPGRAAGAGTARQAPEPLPDPASIYGVRFPLRGVR